MERYDGKTRRDDYRRYALIALAVVLVLGAYVVWRVLTRDPSPDYRLVYGAQETLDEQTQSALAVAIGELVGDRNGDGETVVEVLCVPINPLESTNTTSGFLYLAALMSEPDVDLVLLTDEPIPEPPFRGISNNLCGQEGYFIDLPAALADETFPNRTPLNDTALFQSLGFADGPLLYGSICDSDDERAMALALEVLTAICEGGGGETAHR